MTKYWYRKIREETSNVLRTSVKEKKQLINAVKSWKEFEDAGAWTKLWVLIMCSGEGIAVEAFQCNIFTVLQGGKSWLNTPG